MPGLSTRELDRLAGLTQGHVSAIENGTRPRVELRTAEAIATVLGISLDWLSSGDGKVPSTRSVRAAVEVARAARSDRDRSAA